MFNIKKFFSKLKKQPSPQPSPLWEEGVDTVKNNNNFLQDFIESDIQGSKMILEDIFEIIKSVKNIWEKKEFVWNSFELVFSKNKVNFLNQFTQEKFVMSLKDFEKGIIFKDK